MHKSIEEWYRAWLKVNNLANVKIWTPNFVIKGQMGPRLLKPIFLNHRVN